VQITGRRRSEAEARDHRINIFQDFWIASLGITLFGDAGEQQSELNHEDKHDHELQDVAL
jgi:hypothetical protein